MAGWARATNFVDLPRDTGLLCKAPPCYLNRVIYDHPTSAGRPARADWRLISPPRAESGFHRAPMPGKGRRDSIGDKRACRTQHLEDPQNPEGRDPVL